MEGSVVEGGGERRVAARRRVIGDAFAECGSADVVAGDLAIPDIDCDGGGIVEVAGEKVRNAFNTGHKPIGRFGDAGVEIDPFSLLPKWQQPRKTAGRQRT